MSLLADLNSESVIDGLNSKVKEIRQSTGSSQVDICEFKLLQ